MAFMRQVWTEVAGIKCQGATEARACRMLLAMGHDVARAGRYETPDGWYRPDFTIGEALVEVKSPGTWAVARGLEPMMAKSRLHPEWTVCSDRSWRKMQYLAIQRPLLVMIIGHKHLQVETPEARGIEYLTLSDGEADSWAAMMENMRGT